MDKRERKMAESVVKKIQAKFINKCIENLSFHKQIERATESIIKSYEIGNDFMANCGGAIHGHPSGTLAGTKAMKQAIDKNYQTEYYEAIKKWGKI